MKKSQLLFLFLLMLAGKTYAQRAVTNWDAFTIEADTQLSDSLRQSCLRMWEYDTTSQQQMSAPFSGVIVTPEGHILTVAHTTIPGHIYQVNFYDGRTAIAQALGKINFPETPELPDVAMMKIITPGKWKAVVMGRSAYLDKGQFCMSIAYPESLNQPVPMLRKGNITTVKNEKGFIESTCLMEPGDSGGPMFDNMGRLIGMRSAIGIGEGENYDVPVDLYRKYWTALNQPVHYTKYPELTDSLPVPGIYRKSAVSLWGTTKEKALDLPGMTKYCVKINSEIKGTPVAVNGTVFKVDGRVVVVSKSSAVGASPVILYGKKPIKATIIARNKENDLVLLAPANAIKAGLSPKPKPDTITRFVGRLLLSPQTDTAVIQSVVGKEVFNLPKMYNTGFLGAAIAPDKTPLALTFVMPGSPAAEKGATPGDEIISINGVALSKPEDYGRELYKYWAGDTILITRRSHASEEGPSGTTVHYAAEVTDSVVLGKRPVPPVSHPAEMFRGGRSERRDGFQQVIAHDGILRPEQCGGPVFDAYGHFIGLNIARFSRTVSLALPASVVYDFINTHLPGRE